MCAHLFPCPTQLVFVRANQFCKTLTQAFDANNTLRSAYTCPATGYITNTYNANEYCDPLSATDCDTRCCRQLTICTGYTCGGNPSYSNSAMASAQCAADSYYVCLEGLLTLNLSCGQCRFTNSLSKCIENLVPSIKDELFCIPIDQCGS